MKRRPSPITRLRVVSEISPNRPNPTFGFTSRAAQLFTGKELRALQAAGFISPMSWGWSINMGLLNSVEVLSDPIDCDALKVELTFAINRFILKSGPVSGSMRIGELVDILVGIVVERDQEGDGGVI